MLVSLKELLDEAKIERKQSAHLTEPHWKQSGGLFRRQRSWNAR